MTAPAPQANETGRLLVVDDVEANRDMLSRRLQRRGHDVAVAADGSEALRMIDEDAFDVVLLDIMMPGIDGLEVLRRLRAKLTTADLPIIMVTAKGERESVVEALKLGANDYVTKPIDFPVVHARVQTQLSVKRAVEQIRSLQASLDARNRELEVVNAHMKRDLEAAARVQQALLPTELPGNGPVRFSWKYRPCETLGGDILDIFPIGDSHFGIYLIDVVGHGVPASLLAVTLTRTLDVVPDHPCLVCRPSGSGALEPTPPDEVAHQLNAHFQMDEQSNQYFTLFYGVIDCRTRVLQFVTAGHPGPAHVPSEAAPVDLTTPAFPIGMSDDPGYELQSITLNPGDRLYVYSDGIGEVQNGAGRMLGREGISDILATTHSLSLEASLERLVEAAAEWSGGRFDDDISALAVEIATAEGTPD